MIPKNTVEHNPSDYQKPVEHSMPNQALNPLPQQPNVNKNNNVYQIDDNEISNSIDINYEINMDVNNNPGMHFSNINFESIDGKKPNQQVAI